MSTMTHKGYGRIYVGDADDVGRVRDVIKEMDAGEFEYLPDDLVAPFSEYPKVTYTAKFSDLDADALVATCWSRSIMVWVLDIGRSGTADFYQSQIKAQEPA